MVIKTHRMPIEKLLKIENATGHHYTHTISKADPSIVIMTNSEVDRILDDCLEIIEHSSMRWF